MGNEKNNKTPSESIEQWMGAFLESEYAAQAADSEFSGDFIPTLASRQILSRLRLAAQEHFTFALVHGPAGSGKSVTTNFYIRHDGGLYLRAHPEYSPPALLEDIAAQLRMTRTRVYRNLISMVRDALSLKPQIIAVDEAQLTNRSTRELMKYMGDETGSTFILVTTDEFVSAIRRERDIESRIGVVAGIGPISLKEFSELYADSQFKPEAIEVIHALTGGIMRDILRLLKQIDHVIRLNENRSIGRIDFTPKLVRGVATKLNLNGGTR